MSRYRDWPIAFFFAALIIGGLVFLALFRLGEDVRCAHHTGKPADFCTEQSR